MNYYLPTTATIDGVEYEIRWDYRAALDICTALNDIDLDEYEKAEVALSIFYPQYSDMPSGHLQKALDFCLDFLACGEKDEKSKSGVKLMDWEQDFKFIAPAVNRVIGRDVRGNEPLHWWSFIGAYNEIGDCTFSHIVSIRDKKARGKKLEKEEQEWYKRNRDLIEFKRTYTSAEKAALEALGLK